MNGHTILTDDFVICVDKWDASYLRRPGSLPHYFFLTHLHADHIKGLTSSWSRLIYTSPFNGWLLPKRRGVKQGLLRELDLDVTHTIRKSTDGATFRVTLLDANHCPGAVMFLFEGSFGNILYTGDFRYSSEMLENPILSPLIRKKEIGTLYLDNTYAAACCNFPSREEALEEVLKIIDKHPDHKILVGMRQLGKEEVLKAIALHLNERVCVSPQRLEVLERLEYEDVFTIDTNQSRIHAVELHTVNQRQYQDSAAKTICIKLTSMYECANLDSSRGNVYIVPYSDHSNHSELKHFVDRIRPLYIVPVVQAKLPTLGSSDGPWSKMSSVNCVIPEDIWALCGPSAKLLPEAETSPIKFILPIRFHPPPRKPDQESNLINVNHVDDGVDILPFDSNGPHFTVKNKARRHIKASWTRLAPKILSQKGISFNNVSLEKKDSSTDKSLSCSISNKLQELQSVKLKSRDYTRVLSDVVASDEESIVEVHLSEGDEDLDMPSSARDLRRRMQSSTIVNGLETDDGQTSVCEESQSESTLNKRQSDVRIEQELCSSKDGDSKLEDDSSIVCYQRVTRKASASQTGSTSKDERLKERSVISPESQVLMKAPSAPLTRRSFKETFGKGASIDLVTKQVLQRYDSKDKLSRRSPSKKSESPEGSLNRSNSKESVATQSGTRRTSPRMENKGVFKRTESEESLLKRPESNGKESQTSGKHSKESQKYKVKDSRQTLLRKAIGVKESSATDQKASSKTDEGEDNMAELNSSVVSDVTNKQTAASEPLIKPLEDESNKTATLNGPAFVGVNGILINSPGRRRINCNWDLAQELVRRETEQALKALETLNLMSGSKARKGVSQMEVQERRISADTALQMSKTCDPVSSSTSSASKMELRTSKILTSMASNFQEGSKKAVEVKGKRKSGPVINSTVVEHLPHQKTSSPNQGEKIDTEKVDPTGKLDIIRSNRSVKTQGPKRGLKSPNTHRRLLTSSVSISKQNQVKSSANPAANASKQNQVTKTLVPNPAANTSKQNQVTGTSVPNPAASTSKQNQVTMTSIPNPAANTSKQNQLAVTSIPNPAANTSKQNRVTVTSIPNPAANTSKQNQVTVTSIPNPAAKTSKQNQVTKTLVPNPAANTSKQIQVTMTSIPNPAAATSKQNQVSKTSILSPVVKIFDLSQLTEKGEGKEQSPATSTMQQQNEVLVLNAANAELPKQVKATSAKQKTLLKASGRLSLKGAKDSKACSLNKPHSRPIDRDPECKTSSLKNQQDHCNDKAEKLPIAKQAEVNSRFAEPMSIIENLKRKEDVSCPSLFLSDSNLASTDLTYITRDWMRIPNKKQNSVNVGLMRLKVDFAMSSARKPPRASLPARISAVKHMGPTHLQSKEKVQAWKNKISLTLTKSPHRRFRHRTSNKPKLNERLLPRLPKRNLSSTLSQTYHGDEEDNVMSLTAESGPTEAALFEGNSDYFADVESVYDKTQDSVQSSKVPVMSAKYTTELETTSADKEGLKAQHSQGNSSNPDQVEQLKITKSGGEKTRRSLRSNREESSGENAGLEAAGKVKALSRKLRNIPVSSKSNPEKKKAGENTVEEELDSSNTSARTREKEKGNPFNKVNPLNTDEGEDHQVKLLESISGSSFTKFSPPPKVSGSETDHLNPKSKNILSFMADAFKKTVPVDKSSTTVSILSSMADNFNKLDERTQVSPSLSIQLLSTKQAKDPPPREAGKRDWSIEIVPISDSNQQVRGGAPFKWNSKSLGKLIPESLSIELLPEQSAVQSAVQEPSPPSVSISVDSSPEVIDLTGSHEARSPGTIAARPSLIRSSRYAKQASSQLKSKPKQLNVEPPPQSVWREHRHSGNVININIETQEKEPPVPHCPAHCTCGTASRQEQCAGTASNMRQGDADSLFVVPLSPEDFEASGAMIALGKSWLESCFDNPVDKEEFFRSHEGYLRTLDNTSRSGCRNVSPTRSPFQGHVVRQVLQQSAASVKPHCSSSKSVAPGPSLAVVKEQKPQKRSSTDSERSESLLREIEKKIRAYNNEREKKSTEGKTSHRRRYSLESSSSVCSAAPKKALPSKPDAVESNKEEKETGGKSPKSRASKRTVSQAVSSNSFSESPDIKKGRLTELERLTDFGKSAPNRRYRLSVRRSLDHLMTRQKLRSDKRVKKSTLTRF